MAYWWLSFAESESFRGVAVVRAVDAASALARTRELGINPGGYVGLFAIPTMVPPPAELLDHLVADRGRLAELELSWAAAVQAAAN